MSWTRIAWIAVPLVACGPESTPARDTPTVAVDTHAVALARMQGRLAALNEQVGMAEERLTAAENRLADARTVAADSSRSPAGGVEAESQSIPHWRIEVARAERDVEIARSVLAQVKAKRDSAQTALADAMGGDATRTTDPATTRSDSSGNRSAGAARALARRRRRR